MKYRLLLLFLVLISGTSSYAQNTDLGLQKRWNQLMQLNPALTSYTGELRTLVETGAGLNFGLEAPVLKSKWNTGAFYSRESVTQLIRNRVNVYLSRAYETKNGAEMRLGLNGAWAQKNFFKRDLASYSITDFNGYVYQIDSTVKSNILSQRTYLDAGLGFSYRKKNLLFGFTAKNLLQPDISLIRDLSVKQLPELGIQLGGFIKRGEAQWFPVLLMNQQNGEFYGQFGLNYIRKTLSFGAAYEHWEQFRMLSAQINYRKGPLFLSVRYAADLAVDGKFDSEQVQLVANLSILRKRNLDTFKEILRKLN